MTEALLAINTVLLLGAVVLLALLYARAAGGAPAAQLEGRLDALREGAERMERAVREEIARNREEGSQSARQSRDEMGQGLKAFGDSVIDRMTNIALLQEKQLERFAQQLGILTQTSEQKIEKLREAVEAKLKALQDDNSQKLELMRATVDEKLHATLEKRLGESFKLVSERLELVHKGLGEMQSLAIGVGDLKKVLANVKTRGALGEIQLGNLLEQILTPEQYATNIATRPGSAERVEFAIKLPGRDDQDGHPVWLPIDAKFPQEDYQRLLEAQEQASQPLAEEAGKRLEGVIRAEAKSFRGKYLDPPHTTDFGILFLPVEGLYAEILRRPGLFDSLQRDHRVLVAGPTTLAAILNSLQMGFRTLAIQKRSSEVWTLLGAVKTEFGRFGDILEKTKKKLDEASNQIDAASRKSRTIARKLRDVQDLPAADAAGLIGPAEDLEVEEEPDRAGQA